jgi:hypothetical protein
VANPPPADKGKAGSGGSSAKPDLTPNLLIEKLRSLKAQPARAVELVGYLGSSDKTGFIRLYFALDLSSYVEIPQTEIIFTKSFDPQDPTKPTTVIVIATTRLDIVQNREASFLEGSIAKSYPCGTEDLAGTRWPTTCGPRGPVTKTPCRDDDSKRSENLVPPHPVTQTPCDNI